MYGGIVSELHFYTNPMSRGQIVRWMLEETGLAYETSLLDYGTTMKSDAYLAINPMGKVPAITHNQTVVTECSAIIAYLAELCPEKNLAPAVADRGAYYRWLFFVAGPFEAAITAKSFGLLPGPDKSASVGYGSYEAVMDTIEKLVAENEFVAGNHFTAADLYLGAQLDFGLSFKTLPERQAFMDYRDRMIDRDAYRRAKEIDNALIAKMQS